MATVVDIGARRGDVNRRILEQLYRDHGEALRCFLLGRVQSSADIEDIVQDVFARLARRDDLVERSAEGARKNRAYLFTAANNMVVDLERRRQVRWKYSSANREGLEETVDQATPEIVVVAQEHLALVKEAIKTLKPEWRTAFILNRFKHMTHKEVSAVMGITRKQAERFIAKATLNLYEKVNEMYKGESGHGGRGK